MPFLGRRVPKKGFGGPCEEVSPGLGLGDACPFGFGEPLGGEIDFTVGRNDDAFTFSLFTAVGDNGLVAPDGAALETLIDTGTLLVDVRLPLNGGIA